MSLPWPPDLLRKRLEQIWAVGFRHLRLPIPWARAAGEVAPWRIPASFLERIAQQVRDMLQFGFTVVLDMHHDVWMDAPALSAAPSTAKDEPTWGRQMERQTERQAERQLELQLARAEARLTALWQQVAQRFLDWPPSLWFEIYNEPHGAWTPPRWNALATRVLAELRRVGHRQRIVVIGPSPWNHPEGLSGLQLPDDPALVVGIHHYKPFGFTHQGAPWMGEPLASLLSQPCCSPQQESAALKPLREAAAWANAQGRPLWLSEFGSFSGPPEHPVDLADRARWAALVRQEAERLGIAWCWWELDAGFGLMDSRTGQWRQNLLKALLPSRP